MNEARYNRVLAMKGEIWERFESKLTRVGEETTWDGEVIYQAGKPTGGTACRAVESGFEVSS